MNLHYWFWPRFVGVTLLFYSCSGHAQAFTELNLFYGSDGMTSAVTSATTRTFIEAAVGFAIDKKGDYLVGWNYSSMSTSDGDGTITTTYSSTQMGPRFIFMLDRAKSWSLGLGYYLSTTASVNDGSNNDKWKGTALKADIGYSISIADKLYTGLRLNYSSASYSENFIGGTGFTEVSYSKTAVYPSVSTSYFF